MQLEQISEQLFKIIKGFGHPLQLYTDEGANTVDPNEARRFYLKDIKMMINFINNENSSEFVLNASANTDLKSIKPLINEIRELATRYIIEFTVKTFGKTVTPKDFAYQAKNVNETAYAKNADTEQSDKEYIEQLSFKNKWKKQNPGKKWPGYAKAGFKSQQAKNVTKNADIEKSESNDLYPFVVEGFSRWSGSARKSYQTLNDAKIIIRHKKTVDEDVRGSRTRQIEAVFIENATGERFAFPSTNISAARAMLKHVNEGGTPYDGFGQYILETLNEYKQLKIFERYNKRRGFFEDASDLNEEISNRVNQLRTTLKQIAGPVGYKNHFESFSSVESNNEIGQERLDELKDNVTVHYFDEAITNSLPYVAKIIESNKARKTQEKDIHQLAQIALNGIHLSHPIDKNDPENPDNMQYNSTVEKTSAWLSHLARFAAENDMSNKLMKAAEDVRVVSPKFVEIAEKAVAVMRKKSSVTETTHQSKKMPIDKSAMRKINETFDKYTVHKIFKL